MHENFVDLCEAIPGLAADVRYAGSRNLTGAPLDGYLAPKALATREAAAALGVAFAQAQKLGYGMLVFDAYRPQKAVDCFVRWSQQPEDGSTRAEYYPTLNKADLFPHIALLTVHAAVGAEGLALHEGTFVAT